VVCGQHHGITVLDVGSAPVDGVVHDPLVIVLAIELEGVGADGPLPFPVFWNVSGSKGPSRLVRVRLLFWR